MTPVRVNPVLVHPEQRRLILSGSWSFRLDPNDHGLTEQWYKEPGNLTEKIEVPGCWQGQGFGGDGKDTLWDFGHQVRVFRATYRGTGWYGKRFEVPKEWKGMRLQLNFGGVHPSAEVWLNGVRLGENGLPFAPFGFDVTDAVSLDTPNWLVVRVHEQNRILGLAFNWQGDWSGLYRDVELTATGKRFIKECHVYPNLDQQTLRVSVRLGGAPSDRPVVLRLSTQAINDKRPPITKEISIDADLVEHNLSVPSPRPWSPDSPQLYRVDAVLSDGDTALDAVSERVGFVKLATQGKHFLINGNPYYMRGTGDFISCPETGCPDTNRERWRKKLKTLREYGYNYVRCQSYVYSPEYLDVADEVGLLVQSEMGMIGAWGGSHPSRPYAWPQPDAKHREPLRRQWNLVVSRDVNHPSANIYCMSNELKNTTEFPDIAWQCYRETKMIKPSAFVIWTDGGCNEELPGDFVNDEFECDAKTAKPVIQHEYRWWSSFPDVTAMSKYSGAVRPYTAEIAQETAARRGLSHILPEAVANSKRLQFVEAKTKMEICRRDNPTLAGICHFDAMDMNPSPQGIIDEFYERKYADSSTWLQTNGDTVILCSLGMDNRVLVGGDTLNCELSVSDFSHPSLQRPSVRWELVADQQTLGQGEIAYKPQPYRTCKAGNLSLKIPEITEPKKAILKATLSEGDRVFTNQWNLWLFPNKKLLPASVRIYGVPQHTWLKHRNDIPRLSTAELATSTTKVVLTEQLDPALIEFMNAGGRVILVPGSGLVRPHPPLFGYVKYFFTPPANYGPYDQGQNGTIIQSGSLLGQFPHEGFADLQFFRLMVNSPPLDMEALGLPQTEPTIRVIHRFSTFHPLAYLLESSVGKGGLVLCSMDLNPAYPEARYLLAQICIHAASKDFKPVAQLQNACLERIIAKTIESVR
ncbi:MAG: hypothetical protein JXM70_31025 [Pirellulales bacterium]|nr:hypothetical protein [Pirellulales bacterium]